MSYWALSCSIPETVSRSRRIPIQASLAVTFHYLTRVLPHNNWTRLEYSTAKNSVWHCIPDSYFRRVRQYKSTFKYLDQCISTHALTFHYLCEQPATVGPVPIVLLPICQQRCRRYELWVTWESGERGGNAKTAGSQAWDVPCHENHTFSLYRTFLIDWQELSIAMSQKMLKAIWVTSQHGNLKTGATAIKTLSSLSFCHFLGVIFTVKMV